MAISETAPQAAKMQKVALFPQTWVTRAVTRPPGKETNRQNQTQLFYKPRKILLLQSLIDTWYFGISKNQGIFSCLKLYSQFGIFFPILVCLCLVWTWNHLKPFFGKHKKTVSNSVNQIFLWDLWAWVQHLECSICHSCASWVRGLSSVFTGDSDYVGQTDGGLDRPGNLGLPTE